MRASRLGVAFIAVLLLVPVTVAAGAEEPPQPAVAGKLVSQEGNADLGKVSDHLLQARRMRADGLSMAEVANEVPALRTAGGYPLVEVRFDELTEETVATMEGLGFRSTGAFPQYGVMTGSVDLDLLDEIAALPQVAVIHPQFEPVRSVGSVTSQADTSIRAALARSEFGVDGTGVTVGVMSDSFNDTLGGSVTGSGCAATVSGMANQVTGDLPAAVGLIDNGPGGSDEGAAMAELIYDLAPGADLMFRTAWRGRADFATGINELRGCGADIIVDDISWLNEPMFQDGFVAQAAQDAVDAGVPYLSSAGNNAAEAIAGGFADSNPGTDDTLLVPSGNDFHDFGGGDRFASLVVPNGGRVRFVLQWNEPYSGTLGPGAAVDLDGYLCSGETPGSCTVATGASTQGCSAGTRQGDPFEIIDYTNTTGGDQTVHLAIEHYCGSEDVDFRVVLFGPGSSFEAGIFGDYAIYGHPAAAGVAAVGAVDYREIDSGGSFEGGPEINVEDFSSLGGDLPIYFDPSGALLPGGPITRFKPEIAAPDGTNTTFFTTDSDGDGFPNFFGTSAAAPHAAAVAALILDANPALTPAQVLAAMSSSAIDIEVPGRDPLSGDGLIDARDAVASANTIDTAAPTWPGGSAVTISNVTESGARATWNAATDNVAVTMYRVYLDGSLWRTTSSTLADLTGLSAGTTYTVSVEALDAIGNESTTGPSATFATSDNEPPTWPGGSTLTVSAVTAATATASWSAATDNAGVTSYRVYLNGSLEGSTSSSSLALTGLAGGTSYTAKVEAVDGAGNESTGGPSATFTTDNPLPPGGSFTDDNGNIHEANIEAIAAAGITKGCNPPNNDLYCPASSVTRGQMAAFLVRALGLTDDGGGNKFVDDNGSIFENDIAKLAAAGVTKGCNPPTNDRFCPNDFVTREQMAAFLVRALGLTDDGGGNKFVDDNGSIFENDIAKLAAAGVTSGCNPPTNDRFCPTDPVKRDQMASFLARALNLSPITPPQVQTFGDGVWTVPAQVSPGTYRNSDSTAFCDWARLRGFGGGDSDIIESWLTNEIDIVTISPSDAGFESRNCGIWSTDLSPRTSSPTAAFGGGSFLVGSEVAPGTWRNSDSSASCYWERLSGFGGALDEIIDNSFATTIQTVTIGVSDVGFSSDRCGTWSKIG